MEKEGKNFFDYDVVGGKQMINKCFIKTYIEDNKFSGFKIYPALGYFPFDVCLLPLWKYAADNGIPITTHCIRGTIFYRGKKKEEWNEHPVFRQTCKDGDEPLLLPQLGNEQFSWNFTHPLNYLCLLDEGLLRKVVATASPGIQTLFGFTDVNTKMGCDLSNLKICLAHFGGDDEWGRFMELDRDNYTGKLLECPNKGIEFFLGADGKPSPGKQEQIWKFTDWYTIICSLMLQYGNVYSDISYIVHNDGIRPLLKSTLEASKPKLRSRVLFGTDFYVVRNHKSDRNMLIDTISGLTAEEFNLISRDNPRSFLANRLHGALPI